MKPAVLCVTRQALPVHIPQSNAYGIYAIDLNKIEANQFHFINRDIVDSDQAERYQIGQLLPQILAYSVIRCGNEILTYSRKKGAESRLHGSRSIGFGGHVDIADYSEQADEYIGYLGALIKACERELHEELGLITTVGTRQFSSIIVDQTNPVGSVHVGLPLEITLLHKYEVQVDPEEISDPVWLTIDELKTNIDEYENWSKLLIKQL